MKKTLEQKTEKADWKHWIPVYGMIEDYDDFLKGKPTFAGSERKPINAAKDLLFGVYHVLTGTVTYASLISLYEFAEKLF